MIDSSRRRSSRVLESDLTSRGYHMYLATTQFPNVLDRGVGELQYSTVQYNTVCPKRYPGFGGVDTILDVSSCIQYQYSAGFLILDRAWMQPALKVEIQLSVCGLLL